MESHTSVSMASSSHSGKHRLSSKASWLLVGLSVFFVLFLWRFFGEFIEVLGVNMTIFLGLTLLFFREVAKQKGLYSKNIFHWLIPLGLIAVSYALFENPYLRFISIFVFFFAGLLFAGHATYGFGSERRWSLPYAAVLLVGNINVVARIFRPFHFFRPLRSDAQKASGEVIVRVLTGIIILCGVAGFFIIPLLSSADNEFGILLYSIQEFFQWLLNLIPDEFIPRMVVFCGFFSFFGALGLWWLEAKPITSESSEDNGRVDSLIAGIVLGGIFFLYILFILIQVKHLWNNALPLQFRETEQFVKSGFWQLFALTVLNIAFFIKLHYRSIHSNVRFILNGFVLSSLLLVVSAAQRMFLYAYYYGLSYEKFFASYTVLFCVGVFVWFLWIILARKRVDIFKGLVFASLWAYAVATVLPIEQIVLRTNMTFEKDVHSRILLGEMRMLSPDVLSVVTERYTTLVDRSQKNAEHNASSIDISRHSSDESDSARITELKRWDWWVTSKCDALQRKKFYEMSLSGAWNYASAQNNPHGCEHVSGVVR